MPSPNPTVRRQHSGNAKTTTLSAPIVNGTDTSFTIVDATGWPDGSVGNFEVTINAGQSDVEKILCASRTGTTVTAATRGHDSTTAAGHATTATVAHTISALEIDEMNQHTNATSGVHGVAGAVVGTTDVQVLTSKTLTAPTVTSPAVSGTVSGGATYSGVTLTSAVADAASTVGGVSGTTLAADRTAWTTYTPTFVNIATPTGVFAYKQIGKTLHLRWKFTGGTFSANWTATLPAALTAADQQAFPAIDTNAGTVLSLSVAAAATTIGCATSGNIRPAFNTVIEVA